MLKLEPSSYSWFSPSPCQVLVNANPPVEFRAVTLLVPSDDAFLPPDDAHGKRSSLGEENDEEGEEKDMEGSETGSGDEDLRVEGRGKERGADVVEEDEGGEKELEEMENVLETADGEVVPLDMFSSYSDARSSGMDDGREETKSQTQMSEITGLTSQLMGWGVEEKAKEDEDGGGRAGRPGSFYDEAQSDGVRSREWRGRRQ